jgi:ubiquinone biosynthesis monooxygenase Coq7
VVSGVAAAARQTPAARLPDSDLTDAERRRSAGLMRVNHVGEVCAQALYAAQGQLSSDPGTRAQFREAAREEEDHLAWTAQRLEELNSHTSVTRTVWDLLWKPNVRSRRILPAISNACPPTI